MTLHTPLVGLRSFCELPWPFQFACGQAWAEGQGWPLWARTAHAGLEVEGAVIILRVACRLLLIPSLLQAWGSKLCLGVATSCATVQAGDLAGGFSVWPRCKNSLSCDRCVLSSWPEQTAAHTCTLLTRCVDTQLLVCRCKWLFVYPKLRGGTPHPLL